MKQCPVCYSGNVKEYKHCGVPELHCHDCGYDSGDKNKTYHSHDKDHEREEKVKK